MINTCHFNFLYNLQLNITKNIKFFWAFTMSKRKTNSYPSEFSFNDAKSSDPNTICYMISNFFQSTYNNTPLQFDHEHIFDGMISSSRPMSSIQFSVEIVSNLLACFDEIKNGGPDGIPNGFSKLTHTSLSIPLTRQINKSLRDGVIPTDLSRHLLLQYTKRERNAR